jgi:hypothetical protein
MFLAVIAILIIVEKIELVSSLIYSQPYANNEIWSLDFTIHSTKHGGNTLQVSETILNTIYILSFIHMLKSHDLVF